MFSHFFIERPIFASVLSIVITLAGAVAVFNLYETGYTEPVAALAMVNMAIITVAIALAYKVGGGGIAGGREGATA